MLKTAPGPKGYLIVGVFIVKRPSLHLTAMMGNGLTLSNGDLWLRQRRLMQPAFHRQKIEGLAAILFRSCVAPPAMFLSRLRRFPATIL